jgi:DNA-binding GntR family transcriptional regulator
MISFYSNLEEGSLTERVYLTLRESIVKGELVPGYRLIVLDIAKTLNTSQAPVREALERLKQEGLIVSKPNKGSMVADISLDEIKEIYVLRELVEGYVLKQTIPTLSPSDFDYLMQLYMDLKKCATENNVSSFVDVDMKFHGFFYERCQNQVILNVWNQINVKIKRFTTITNRVYFPDLDVIAETHLPLIQLIQTGDVDRCEKAFLDHMREVWWRIKKDH